MAIGQPNVDLAAWAAAPYGWTARPASQTTLAAMEIEGRAVELVHARVPIVVIVVEETPKVGCRGDRNTSSGAFVCLSAGLDGANRLSTVLEHPDIRQLVTAIGAVSRRNRIGRPNAVRASVSAGRYTPAPA